MKKYFLFSTACLFAFSVSVAEAGFQWHPSKTKVKHIQVETAPKVPATGPAVQAAPVETVDHTPEVIWHNQHTNGHGVTETVKNVDLSDTVLDVAVETLPAPVEDVQDIGAEVAFYGFGKDIPLVIAVDQIIPEEYNPIFSPHIHLGQRISWSENISWQHALESSLTETGLAFDVRGKSVYVFNVKDGARHAPSAVKTPVTGSVPAPIVSTENALPDIPVVESPVTQNQGDVLLPIEITNVEGTSADQLASPVPLSPRVSGASVSAPAPQTETVVWSSVPPEATDLKLLQANAVAITTQKATGHTKWLAGSGETLRETLQRWSDQNSSKLYWLIDYDYDLEKPVAYEGSFETAVESLLDEFESIEPRPYGQLYRSADSSHVLAIKAYGVE